MEQEMVTKIKRKVEFPRMSFDSAALDMWIAFIELLPDGWDLAHWLLEADSGTIRVSARNSMLNEFSPEWKGVEPVVVVIEGIVELFGVNEKQNELLRSQFQEWATTAIKKGFMSSKIQKAFRCKRTLEDRFAIVSATTDWGLGNDSLTLLWSSDSKFGIEEIQAMQKRPRRKGAPKKIVRKKR
jgi:hypothetical protein